jgi:ankyrin repeat protein
MLIIVLLSASNLSAQDIFDAVRTGKLDSVKTAIEQHPDSVNARTGTWKKTPLHIAVETRNKEIVAFLLDNGALVDEKDQVNATPLHSASFFDKQGNIARLLLEHGANPNAVDDFQTSVLMQASKWAPNVVDHLLDFDVILPSMNEAVGKDLFMNSAQQGLTRLYSRFIERGADIHEGDSSGNSLLHKAASGGQLEIINKLLEEGLDVSLKNLYGWLPLHFAAEKGHRKVAAVLLAKGADIDSRTIDGNTAYNLAIEMDNKDVAEFLSSKGANRSAPKFPKLTGQYFNQSPPGKIAEQFAAGIVASRHTFHSSVTFSADGKEAYWAVLDYGKDRTRAIIESKMKNGRWTLPKRASFSQIGVGDDVPFISPDGKQLFFSSWRPAEKGGKLEKENIWVMDRIGNSWSEPYPLPPIINSTEDIHHALSIDLKRNLYFGASPEGGYGASDIYCSKYENGEYQRPINLGPIINGGRNEGQPYIAPDGSYLIFNKYKPIGWSIFISYLKEDRSWTEPKDLIDILKLSDRMDVPIVTRDGKYLFFLSKKGLQPSKLYWIDAGFIEQLRPVQDREKPT